MKNQLCLVLLALTAAGFTATAASAERHSVGSLINERLSYMKDVAGDKAQHHQAVEDLVQEKKVLEKAVADADALGIKGETVKPFIQAQMDAAKAIQYRYRADWLSVPENGWTPRPLNDVREKIGQLSYAILQTVAERLKSGGALTEQEKAHFMQDISQKNLNNQDKLLIWNALRMVSL
ncbi:chorismate mutase [Enterobacter asburiae]|uniref:chorismate mutase n=1 Tax=Enterobacter asburiae TaxID=61645 RepID=UPI001E517155|nr:chorismate mutase [Enterobacter asburiae]MCE2004221.1 chorismate mutase [Enterobacter asburiae]